ncbi:MAG: efflux RND transporter permease subunit [Planctomycetaceae bacterium]
MSTSEECDLNQGPSDPLSRIVRIFLESNLSIILIVFSLIIGVAALLITPREEDPQIVVPLADIYVNFPGHSATEVEQLVSTPLERVLYQIDGVEYVYSMSRENQAIITVRFFVGQDRERSLVKLFKKLDENRASVPPGVTGWVMKPVEIDDVPVTTLTLKAKSESVTAAYDSHALRRIGEELVERLAEVPQVSRAEVIGGEPRTVHIRIDPERLRGYRLSVLDLQRAIQGANPGLPAGDLIQQNSIIRVEAISALRRPDQLNDLVVGVSDTRPVFLKDVAVVEDAAEEVVSYVRHGWGPARHFGAKSVASDEQPTPLTTTALSTEVPNAVSLPAVTVAISKQKGANAVTVAERVLAAAEELQKSLLPADVELIVTRNNGHTANEKVNELVEGLGIAIVIVIALLTLSLGWREAFIVAVAVPVVFGLTLAVNLLFGYTINRVTLFALILALGLLVDDPIVDVENIARHFEEKKKASRRIVLEAVAEIRPPLISATLAVIVSFLPMFFITGMMGPYMSPMALNVPVSMVMSMLVAFTITPWLCFHLLKGKANAGQSGESTVTSAASGQSSGSTVHEIYDPEVVKQSFLYRFFKPIMVPMLKTRMRAVSFLLLMAGMTLAAVAMAATRSVPLKMLPFDNKNEFLLVLDLDEGTSLEQTSAVVSEFEQILATVPEVRDFVSYVGMPGPIDFNGLVRHYYLRQSPNLAEIRVNLVGKKERQQQSHAITLRLRDELTKLAEKHQGLVRLVELPPGPPVLASVVAEVYGRPDNSYQDLLDSASVVADRMRKEPGLVETDDIRDAAARKLVFVTDQEKAALAGVSVADIATTLQIALSGTGNELVRVEHERRPLRINLRLPMHLRSSAIDLGQLHVRNASGGTVALAELGRWEETRVDQTIYHKNLRPVVYVFAECAGRPPAECIVDIQADQTSTTSSQNAVQSNGAGDASPRPVNGRTYFANGSGLSWNVPEGIDVVFSGEGEWKITLDVFRDLGLAFAAAMVMIYIILVAQTGSFALPIVVMMAIPLTVIGVMPGFWMLNVVSGSVVGGYADPVYFTATAMIGMIALAGIVTRDSIILVDFIELAMRHGRPLFDAILESRVVRLRPILLTAGAALLSSIPITLDPIFSGLGWSLIFGLISSTLFTLFVIPVSYWLLKR